MRSFHGVYSSISSAHRMQHGMALPTALLLILVLAISGAMFSRVSVQGLKIVSSEEATSDTFHVAEGAIHDVISKMSLQSSLWRNKPNIEDLPSAYTSYSPLSYTTTNGIPDCAGINCMRSLYPNSGGLIKNFGPIGGDGDSVNTGRTIFNQIDDASPPTPDVTLNGLNGWSQVEHLDEILLDAGNLGTDLASNPGGGGSSSNIRFRITGTAQKTVKDRTGRSTVVVIVELPAS